MSSSNIPRDRAYFLLAFISGSIIFSDSANKTKPFGSSKSAYSESLVISKLSLLETLLKTEAASETSEGKYFEASFFIPNPEVPQTQQLYC